MTLIIRDYWLKIEWYRKKELMLFSEYYNLITDGFKIGRLVIRFRKLKRL